MAGLKPSPSPYYEHKTSDWEEIMNAPLGFSKLSPFPKPKEEPNELYKQSSHIEPSLPCLPTELVERVFSNLSPVQSVCLGLTCRAFYSIHRRFHGKVGLYQVDQVFGCSIVVLYNLLKVWQGKDLIYVHPRHGDGFFVKKQKVEEWLKKNKGLKGFLGIEEWH